MACRPSFDLTKKWGWINLRHTSKKSLLHKWLWDYILKDTFGHYICGLFGHSKKVHHLEDVDGTSFDLCNRCYKRISLHSKRTEG